MTPNLGARSANLRALLETRVVDLERTTARLDCRHRRAGLTYTGRRVVKATHGFTVGQWVKLVGSTWSTAATGSTLSADVIAMVHRVIDPNTIDVVTAGYVQVIGQSFTAWARYYLSTVAGTATTTAPVSPNVLQPLGIGHEDGWFEVFGNAAVTPRSVSLSQLLDVTITSVQAGDRLKYDAATSKWINAPTLLSQLGDVTIASVLNLQVLSYDTGTLKWVNRTLAAGATTLAALTDVSLTTPATLDFLRYVGAVWINASLGEIQWASASRTLALDGGASASAASKIGIGKADSRFLMGSGTGIEWVLSGDPDINTEKALRIRRTAATEVGIYDQATSTFASGDLFGAFVCGANYAARAFRLAVALELVDNSGAGSRELILKSTAAGIWVLTDDLGVDDFLHYHGYTAAVGAKLIEWRCNHDLNGTTRTIYADQSISTSFGFTLGLATATLRTDAGTIAINAGAGTITLTSTSLGFFGSAGSIRDAVAAPVAITVTGTAIGTDAAMVNALKTDVTNLQSKLAEIRTALAGYNLV